MKIEPKYWCRFIDDVWCLVSGTENDINNFIETLNLIDPNIQFTATFLKEKIQFLDLWTIKSPKSSNNFEITTDLFVKETDSHSYLNYNSCHPLSIKNAIPYSQFLRLRRNCTHWINFMRNSLQM